MTDTETASTIDDQIIPDNGQDATVEGTAENTPEVDQELFDYTELADKVIKLQVNGEEVTVPLKEALAGYQRQADYTRKTQELSEQKKKLTYAEALAEALQKDPAGTIKLLNQQYGVQEAPKQDEWTDPADQKVSELEKRIIAFEQKQAMDELAKTIDSLQSKYGEDFNADEVVAKALATGQTDLEAVYKQVAFDRVYSKASEANKKLADEQARLDAKRKAAVVSGGTSSKAAVQPAKAQPKTVFEAFEAAKKDLNA